MITTEERTEESINSLQCCKMPTFFIMQSKINSMLIIKILRYIYCNLQSRHYKNNMKNM